MLSLPSFPISTLPKHRVVGDVLVDSRLDEFYDDIVGTVESDEDIIAKVFPSPPAVLSQLIQRIFEQRVCTNHGG